MAFVPTPRSCSGLEKVKVSFFFSPFACLPLSLTFILLSLLFPFFVPAIYLFLLFISCVVCCLFLFCVIDSIRRLTIRSLFGIDTHLCKPRDPTAARFYDVLMTC